MKRRKHLPLSALVSGKYVGTFYPFLHWGDGGFSNGRKGVLMARGSSDTDFPGACLWEECSKLSSLKGGSKAQEVKFH